MKEGSSGDVERARSDVQVGDLARRLDGCVGLNHAQDVLDVMDALTVDFMPMVDDFNRRKVVGVITRWELARILERFGTSARVVHGGAVLLPTVAEDTRVDQVVAVAGNATAYVVVDGEGRLHGLYLPDATAKEGI